MSEPFLIVHPDDDMVVALKDCQAGETASVDDERIALRAGVRAKHKFARRTFSKGDLLRMYGVIVGRATTDLAPGDPITTENLEHATSKVTSVGKRHQWSPPDVSRWQDHTFMGYLRDDGNVGTRNYWILVPLVFCENRNLRVLSQSLAEELGYGQRSMYRNLTQQLLQQHREGADAQQLLETSWLPAEASAPAERPFPNVDGIKFLYHQSGCGCTNQVAEELCGLLAGYINHPNVAGATVFSLGCQKSQIKMLQDELHRRNPNFSKPLYVLDQQQSGTEQMLLTNAIKRTFVGLAEVNRQQRQPAELAKITLGVECGGSDGFSGISANPAIGHCSDLLVALGGSVILAEFPELAGCEQEIVDRCLEPAGAERFLQLMRSYNAEAESLGAGFKDNPSPGNIRDGLITDAIKSAGAAKKGGTSPVTDVLDYPESVTKSGLNLLCTPGGDVESTTAIAGAGATVQIFSTGLGTPTGNPVSPMLKVSSNTELAMRMTDIIDLDAGTVIYGKETIEQVGQRMLERVLATASGQYVTKAQLLGQDDFIPWRRGISL